MLDTFNLYEESSWRSCGLYFQVSLFDWQMKKRNIFVQAHTLIWDIKMKDEIKSGLKLQVNGFQVFVMSSKCQNQHFSLLWCRYKWSTSNQNFFLLSNQSPDYQNCTLSLISTKIKNCHWSEISGVAVAITTLLTPSSAVRGWRWGAGSAECRVRLRAPPHRY